MQVGLTLAVAAVHVCINLCKGTSVCKTWTVAITCFSGDLWSYNYLNEEFVVSPSPDVCVRQLDPDKDKCLVFGSDGLWNMMSAEEAVSMVMDLEYHFQQKVINDPVCTSVLILIFGFRFIVFKLQVVYFTQIS